jgi:hypothetical protein
MLDCAAFPALFPRIASGKPLFHPEVIHHIAVANVGDDLRSPDETRMSQQGDAELIAAPC